MFKSLFKLMLLIWLIAPAFAESTLVLNLDEPVNTQLLPTAQYYADPDQRLNFSTVQSLEPTLWKSFNREQFRLGFTSGFTWVRTAFRTTGNTGRDVSLKLHHSLENQTIRLTTRGEEAQLFTLGLGAKPTPTHGHQDHDDDTLVKTKLDHAGVRLLPNKTYHLVLRSHSANPVISDFRIVDDATLIAEEQVLNSWLYSYLLLALLVIIYNSSILLISRDVAYLYHISYLLSVMLYLLTDSGYLSMWFELYDLRTLQRLTLLGLSGGLLSILLFFRVMNSKFSIYSPTVKYIYNAIISINIIIVLIMFVTPYEIGVKLFTLNVSVTLLTSFYLASKVSFSELIESFFKDYRSMILWATLSIFTPLAMIHLLTRMGLINVNWFTNHVLFIALFVEVFLIAGMLLLNIRHSKNAYQLEELTNSLSALPNDIALERQLQTLENDTSRTLLQIWVSGFDGLRTTLGPAAFRDFLISFGQIAKQHLNQSTLVAPSQPGAKDNDRLFHSDLSTFILLCKPLSVEDQRTILDTIKRTISTAIDPYYEHFDFKVTVGAYLFESAKSDHETIIQKSILALSNGIEHDIPFSYYAEHIGVNETRRNRLIGDFAHSLRQGDFFLLWQPQFDTHQNVISGVEVLARWKHREYGLVGPDEFVPLLEQSHRISDLTKWVINKVFDELPRLHESAGKVEVSINLSTRDLSNNELIELLNEKLVTASDLVPYVTMEITESMMIDDYQVVLANVNKLQRLGFKISIDDFGTGYASFAYLQSLPADELKIDKCYTDRFEEPRTSAILTSVIELAKSLNISIVVEGVESTQQIERFTKLEVDRLQGWALGKPMSLDDLIIKAS